MPVPRLLLRGRAAAERLLDSGDAVREHASSIPGVHGIQQQSSVAPRIGVAWNLRGNGRTAIKLNWGRFYFNTGLGGANINPAQSLTYTFNWIDANKDRQFTMDEMGSFVSNAGGTTNTIDPNHQAQPTPIARASGSSISSSRTSACGWGTRTETDGNISTNVELQRLGSLYTSQLVVADNGVDGLLNTADDGPSFIVWDIPTGVTIPTSRTETRTVTSMRQIDRAVDFTINRRLRNNWSLMANVLYNWDRTKGYPQNPNQEPFNDTTITNLVWRVVGTYHAKWGIVISPALRFQGGEALARQISVSSGVDPATGVSRNLRTGTLTYTAEGPGSYREQNVVLFDTRFEKRFQLNGISNASSARAVPRRVQHHQHQRVRKQRSARGPAHHHGQRGARELSAVPAANRHDAAAGVPRSDCASRSEAARQPASRPGQFAPACIRRLARQ